MDACRKVCLPLAEVRHGWPVKAVCLLYTMEARSIYLEWEESEIVLADVSKQQIPER